MWPTQAGKRRPGHNRKRRYVEASCVRLLGDPVGPLAIRVLGRFDFLAALAAEDADKAAHGVRLPHLRSSGAYKDGWIFGHALVQVNGQSIEFQIKEAGPPHGEGRITKLADWGMLGRIQKHQPESAPAK